MNQEKLNQIHAERGMSTDWEEVTSQFADTNNLQFFRDFTRDEIVARCYTNRSKKPRWYYRFKSEEQLQKVVNDTIENNNASLQKKEEYKKSRMQPHTLKVGDFLYSSWGYDQTNIDFFKVIDVVGKNTIKVAKVRCNVTPTQYEYSDNVTPTDEIISDIATCRVNGRTNSISINSFSYAYPWDGVPKKQTASGWGH